MGPAALRSDAGSAGVVTDAPERPEARPAEPDAAADSALIGRLSQIQRAIAEAAAGVQRTSVEVRLCAVSKGHSADAIRAAYAAGQRDFGESYAGELQDKAAALAGLVELRWHFVGHLQRNKMKVVLPHCHLIHGLDSAGGIAAADRAAAGLDRRLDVLIQVNVAADEAKSGCSPAELASLVEAVAAAPHLRLRGLMTIPALAADPAPAFAALAALLPQARAALRSAGGQAAADADACDELSMGMSDDFGAAIAAGATIVRVGTAIFGPRRASA